MATIKAGENGRVRILDIVISDMDGWSSGTYLTVKVSVATTYQYNLSSDVRRLRFDSYGYEDREHGFTGKHPLKDSDLGSLELHAQTSADYDTSRLYGEDLEYKDLYRVKLDDAQRMSKTLTHIDKAMKAKIAEDGYHLNFGQYVARFGTIVGCVGARIELPTSLVPDWASDNFKYETTMGDVAYELPRYAEVWWKKQQKESVEEVAS